MDASAARKRQRHANRRRSRRRERKLRSARRQELAMARRRDALQRIQCLSAAGVEREVGGDDR